MDEELERCSLTHDSECENLAQGNAVEALSDGEWWDAHVIELDETRVKVTLPLLALSQSISCNQFGEARSVFAPLLMNLSGTHAAGQLKNSQPTP